MKVENKVQAKLIDGNELDSIKCCVNHDINVYVRKFPISTSYDNSIVLDDQITIKQEKINLKVEKYYSYHRFNFDKIIDSGITNAEMFDDNVKGLVKHSISGGCSTIIAYGQTGTGKTYTLLNKNDGLIFQSLKYAIEAGYIGKISFCEIYLNQITDCLNKNCKVTLLEQESDVLASGLSSTEFKSYEEAYVLIAQGMKKRKTALIGKNESSRSHAIIFINFFVESSKNRQETFKNLSSENCLVFVDLAGNETSQDQKNNRKDNVKEAHENNKSLLALKECIRDIYKGSKYLPFRHSKLTQILKNVLVGNSKTLFISTISTLKPNITNTLNTLEYASRMKDFTQSYHKTDTYDKIFIERSYKAFSNKINFAFRNISANQRRLSVKNGTKNTKNINDKYISGIKPCTQISFPFSNLNIGNESKLKNNDQVDSKAMVSEQKNDSINIENTLENSIEFLEDKILTYRELIFAIMPEIIKHVDTNSDSEKLEMIYQNLNNLKALFE